MSTALTYLNAPEFADDQLTEAINILPYVTGRPAQLGIFTDTPIHTTYVRIGVSDQELTVIPARERGGESNLNRRGDNRGVVSFDIPHFPLDDAITPADIQNLTVWGEGDVIMAGLEDVYDERLTALRAKHDFTHYHLDWGALNGVIMDGDERELLNLYDKFDLVQHTVEYNLESPSAQIANLNRQVKAYIRRELRGTQANGLRVLAGAKFFDMYVNHSTVREELRDYKGSTPNPGRDDIQDVFEYAGLTLERIDEQYRVRQSNGTLVTKDAVPEDEAIVVPLGTPFFKRYIAPPDTISGANHRPDPDTKVFVSTVDLPHDKGREIHTESNVLPICTRPQLLVRLKL
ncbi:hypothetical protein SRABI05_00630 [Agrobacterium fabrum]|uniref:major capsid protein n=1 Tax=Agrobacterium fabrum TaxID=1176649 RepID=UPI001D67AE78|nr:major capsid protein [Agrobacterium fabrum]CAH0154508.1 hypothetical protein SRABI05_00630 [Agrobacterium fabrum]CAH0174069.1 hypothetical protein SRABI46_01344 [Agrobacterium fabrum]